MRKNLLALAVVAALLAGCGGGGSSGSSPAPVITATPAPTATATPATTPFSLSLVTASFVPTPFPNPVTSLTYPNIGSQYTATISVNGGIAPYTTKLAPACGFGGNSNISVTPVGTTQFALTPIAYGIACVITVNDSSTPAQAAQIQITVNGLSGIS